MIHTYRIRANKHFIIIQKKYTLWTIPLWWYNLGYDGEETYIFPKTYINIKNAENAIEKFCKRDRQKERNKTLSYNTVQEITCKDIKKG